MNELEKLMEQLSRMSGCSVTQRIKQVKQPRGGYIKPKALTAQVLGEGIDALNPDEATHAGLVGTAVDLNRLGGAASIRHARRKGQTVGTCVRLCV